MTEAEFNRILEKYQMTIIHTIHNMVYSWEVARDLSQEVFIRLWENRKKIKPDKPVFNFLYRVAINRSIDHLRKIKPEFSKMDYEDILSSDDLTESELYKLIIHCTRHLQPKQRAVFILRDIEGLDFQDIENILELPAGNLQSNLYLARQNIRKLLAKKFNIEREFIYEIPT